MENNSKTAIMVTPTAWYRSRGVWLSALLLPLNLIHSVRDFMSMNPEAGIVLATLWGWFIRIISGSPLVIK